ncbi:glycosyltransferase [Vibrio cyclitrophicus]
MKKIYSYLCDKFGFNRFSPVYDLGFDGRADQKRVMISYLSDGLLQGLNSFSFTTNRHENSIIIKEFITQGYVVDIYDCRDTTSDFDSKKYDFIFGFGYPFRSGKLTEGGVRILYCTESHPELLFSRESKRVEEFNARHNASLKNERSGAYYKSEDYFLANDFYVMGEANSDYLINTIRIDSNKISLINPTGIEPTYTKAELKSKANDFLWFGSRGFILKGLDIVIEAFLQTNFENKLHICGVDEKVIRKFYPKLNERFVFHGQVDVKEDRFKTILEQCSYIVLASASEGVSTSILTGMRHGLIPIVSKECGLRNGKLGVEFEECSISEIKNVMTHYARKSNVEIERLSKEIYSFANKEFCLTSYEKQINELISRLK